MSRSSSGGFTLIELMISVALIAVIAAIAVPSYRDFNQKTQLTGAAEEVFSHIQYARSESIANGEDIFVAFKGTGATGWCVGISDGAACDCAASLAACTINGVQARSLQGNDYPQTVLTTDFAADDSGFSAPRAISMESGDITISLPGYGSAEVQLNTLGRLRLCSGTLNVYADCP